MGREHWIWLAMGVGPAAHNSGHILDKYGCAEEIYAQRHSLFDAGVFTKNQCRRLLTGTLESARQHVEQHFQMGVQIATMNENVYPPQLLDMINPPIALYYKGDLRSLHDKLCIGVVGTRKPSAYGIEVTKEICKQLVQEDVCIVSGLAYGLDSEAHRAAIVADVPTVAVVGTGLNVYYPAKNKQLQLLIEKCGAVVSEYPVEYPVDKSSFVQRNRIIAALSKGLCVAEARLHSGTMSTVNFALSYGRDVFTVPGSIFSPLSEGTNKMLKEGATAITAGTDILAYYGVICPESEKTKQEQPQQRLTDTEQKVLETLSMLPVGVEYICTKTQIAANQVMSALTMLELNGLIRQQAGRQFTKNI
ncbi:MAG: DNA-processing protein DprA [Oscillospiraceae bacterium]|nr:DNA-processing protein DprA [Oscillospiraceae bacterium]